MMYHGIEQRYGLQRKGHEITPWRYVSKVAPKSREGKIQDVARLCSNWKGQFTKVFLIPVHLDQTFVLIVFFFPKRMLQLLMAEIQLTS